MTTPKGDSATTTTTRKKPGPKPRLKIKVPTIPERSGSGGSIGAGVPVGVYWIGTYPPSTRRVENPAGGFDDVEDPTVRPDHGYPPRTHIIVPEVGICFPQRTNPITSRNKDLGVQERTTYFGGIGRFTKDQVELLADVLERSWVRWRSRRNRLQDYGHIITLPRPEAIERNAAALKRDNKPYRALATENFVARPTDEPLAKWLYMVRLADDTIQPPQHANEDLPKSILELGLEVPE